jgi:hypothetical protein
MAACTCKGFKKYFTPSTFSSSRHFWKFLQNVNLKVLINKNTSITYNRQLKQTMKIPLLGFSTKDWTLLCPDITTKPNMKLTVRMLDILFALRFGRHDF